MINGVCSEGTNVTSGIPQGGFLGAILFTIFINSLGGVRHSVKTPNADYCYFHMEILYVDIYKFVTCSMNIL